MQEGREVEGKSVIRSKSNIVYYSMRCGIIVLITLGVFMISPVDSFRSFSPKGTSCITCGLDS